MKNKKSNLNLLILMNGLMYMMERTGRGKKEKKMLRK